MELIEQMPLSPSATVVDVAAGTGKLTRTLAARFARVIAVEPDDAMRRLIDGGEAVAGTAEALPLLDASVDAVFTADAFHWFDGERAVAEFARVLRPGGVVALLWNRTEPADNIVPEGVLPRSPRSTRQFVDSGEWRNALGGELFERLHEASVRRERRLSRGHVLDYFASMSSFTSLPADEREQALARLAHELDRDEYTQRWTSLAYWTRRV